MLAAFDAAKPRFYRANRGPKSEGRLHEWLAGRREAAARGKAPVLPVLADRLYPGEAMAEFLEPARKARRARTATRGKAEEQTMRQIPSSGRKPETIDQYLAQLGAEQRAALQKLREMILETIPEAEECISYGVPSFRLKGRFLLSLGATPKHCAFYPGAVVDAYKEELKGYSTSKGTIRFQPDSPLPKTLVRKLVRAQVKRKLE